MFKRVLFCIPPYSGIFGWPGVPHPGIGYLSQFLLDHDIENEVIDMRLGYTLKDVLEKARKFNADLIGFTSMTFQHDSVYRLINEVKKAGYKVVVGGPHVSVFRSKVLEDCNADFAVRVEGEYPLLELCKGKPLEKIKNLIYKKSGGIVENECREPIDLDGLSFPRYEKFEMEMYRTKAIPIVTSRGCPYNCIYCSAKLTMGSVFRFRRPENIFGEVKYWYKKEYRHFYIFDDNFTLIKERVHEFCGIIEKSRISDLVFACDNGVRADRVDKELLTRMKGVGFRYISFGVEAGTNKVLKAIKKGEHIEVIEDAIKNACELGFEVTLFFLIGSPTETMEDIRESIKLSLRYRIKDVRFYNIIPFPRTELYEWIEKNSEFLRDPNTYLNSTSLWDDEPIFETKELSYEERKEVLRLTKKIRNTIRRRWFREKISDIGFVGKVIAPLLQYEFIRDPILHSRFVKKGPLRSLVVKVTESVFK